MADQETALATGGEGFIAKGTDQLANFFIMEASALGIKLSPEAAKIMAAITVMLVIGCAAGAAGGVEVGVLVGAFVAQSSGLFTDIADAQIASQHIDPNSKEASDIKLGWAVAGAAVCLMASLGAAYSMGTATSDEEAEATALSQVTEQLQQKMADLLKYITNISQTTSEQVMTGALAVGSATEIGLMITQSIMSGILAQNTTQTARTQRNLDYSMADLDLTKVTGDQLEAVAETQAAIAEKEVSKLAESMNSYLSHVDQAALGSVIQV
jgi:hypothetical protein